VILTLISPAGERWSAALCEFQADAIRELSIEQIRNAKAAITPLLNAPLPPKGKSLLSHKATGWQAILSNP